MRTVIGSQRFGGSFSLLLYQHCVKLLCFFKRRHSSAPKRVSLLSSVSVNPRCSRCSYCLLSGPSDQSRLLVRVPFIWAGSVAESVGDMVRHRDILICTVSVLRHTPAGHLPAYDCNKVSSNCLCPQRVFPSHSRAHLTTSEYKSVLRPIPVIFSL